MTNEEIAEQGIVEREEGLWKVMVGDNTVFGLCYFGSQNEAVMSVDNLRKAVLPLLARAREEGAREATAHNLPGPPMSEEEPVALLLLATSKVALAELSQEDRTLITNAYAHIRWLTARLRDVSDGESWGDGYRAGYKAAKEEDAKEMAQLQTQLVR